MSAWGVSSAGTEETCWRQNINRFLPFSLLTIFHHDDPLWARPSNDDDDNVSGSDDDDDNSETLAYCTDPPLWGHKT